MTLCSDSVLQSKPSSLNTSTVLVLSWFWLAKAERKTVFFHILHNLGHKKPPTRLLRVHAHTAAGQMHVSPHWFHPPHASHSHSFSTPIPLLLHLTFLASSLCYTCLASVKHIDNLNHFHYGWVYIVSEEKSYFTIHLKERKQNWVSRYQKLLSHWQWENLNCPHPCTCVYVNRKANTCYFMFITLKWGWICCIVGACLPSTFFPIFHLYVPRLCALVSKHLHWLVS